MWPISDMWLIIDFLHYIKFINMCVDFSAMLFALLFLLYTILISPGHINRILSIFMPEINGNCPFKDTKNWPIAW